MAALYAAAVHDFAHPGSNNAHETKVSSPAALRFSDDAILEHHHLEQSFRCLHAPRNNFLAGLSREAYREFRSIVIDMVLATDLSKHFDFVSQLKAAPPAALSPEHAGPNEPTLLLTAMIKMCDLGHSFKPWAQHERWSNAVTEEFFALGDRERESCVLVSPLCDRHKDTNLPKNQLGFFEFLCFPFYKAVARVMPGAEELLPRLEANFDEWKRRRQAQLDAEVAKIDAQVVAANYSEPAACASTAPGVRRLPKSERGEDGEHSENWRRTSLAALRERIGQRFSLTAPRLHAAGHNQQRASTCGRLETCPAPAPATSGLSGFPSFRKLQTGRSRSVV